MVSCKSFPNMGSNGGKTSFFWGYLRRCVDRPNSVGVAFCGDFAGFDQLSGRLRSFTLPPPEQRGTVP
jgi:hypothetical protein